MSVRDPKTSGKELEERLEVCIRQLEKIGLAKNIRANRRLVDRDGIARQIDLTFTLHTWVIDLRVTVECKSRGRAISLSDTDQIRQYKANLPKRNIYWLVVDGPLTKQAAKAVEAAGISAYLISDLEETVKGIVASFHEQKLEDLREAGRQLSICWAEKFWQTVSEVEWREHQLIGRLPEVAPLLVQSNFRRLDMYGDESFREHRKQARRWWQALIEASNRDEE